MLNINNAVIGQLMTCHRIITNCTSDPQNICKFEREIDLVTYRFLYLSWQIEHDSSKFGS